MKLVPSQCSISTPGNSSSHSKASKGLRTQKMEARKPSSSNSTICSSKGRIHASTLIKTTKKTSNCIGRLIKHSKPGANENREKSKGYSSSRQPMLLLNLKKTNEQVFPKRTLSKNKVTSARGARLQKENKRTEVLSRNRKENAVIKKQKSEKSRNKRTIKFLTNISNKLLIEKKREEMERTEKSENSVDDCKTVIEYDCDNDYSWIYNSLGGY